MLGETTLLDAQPEIRSQFCAGFHGTMHSYNQEQAKRMGTAFLKPVNSGNRFVVQSSEFASVPMTMVQS